MKMVPCDVHTVDAVRTNCKNHKVLMEFVESNHGCVELVDYPQKNAHSCAASFTQSIRRFNLNSIKVLQRGNKVFLIKSI